jgi:hypothetical protein
MATQTRRRAEEDESTDDAGRHHDSRGRFTSNEGESGSRSGNGSNVAREQSHGNRGGSASSRERDERGRFESDDEDDEEENEGSSRRGSSRPGQASGVVLDLAELLILGLLTGDFKDFLGVALELWNSLGGQFLDLRTLRIDRARRGILA